VASFFIIYVMVIHKLLDEKLIITKDDNGYVFAYFDNKLSKPNDHYVAISRAKVYAFIFKIFN